MKKSLLLLLFVVLFIQLTTAQNKQQNNHNSLPSKYNEELPNPRNKTISENNDYGNPPNWNWESKFGGSGNDYARKIATDSDGNVYVVGSFSGETKVESTTINSTGEREAIISKFNNSGNLVWLKTISVSEKEYSDAYGLCIDNSNNIYVIGYYTGSISVGDFDLSNDAIYNLFLIKLNSDGNYLMAKSHGINDQYRIGLNIDLDASGNIYLVGSSNNEYIGKHASVFIKFDASGNLLWEKFYDESFNDIKVAENHLYICGNHNKSNDGIIDDFFLTLTGYDADAFLLKGDLDGNFKWIISSEEIDNGVGSGFGTGLCIDSEENIYLNGNFLKRIKFGDTILTESSYKNKTFVAKFDSSGTFSWANAYTGYTSGIHLDEDKHLFVVSDSIVKLDSSGATVWKEKDTLDVQNIFVNENKITYSGQRDGLINLAQTDTSSTQEWLVEFDGDSGYADIIGMASDTIGNIYSYGYTSSEIDYYGQALKKGLFVSKIDHKGNLIWLNELHGVELKSGFGNYMAIDPANENIFITGRFSDPLEIVGEETLTPVTEGSVFIVKYGFNGEYKLSIQEDFNGSQLCVTTDYSGNILWSGVYDGPINISGIDLAGGFSDVFIAKYSSNGTIDWAINAGGDDTEYSGLVATDKNDNVFLTGEFTSQDISIENTTATLNEGDGNIILSKISPAGVTQWIKSFGGTPYDWGDYNSWPTGIKINTDSDVYIYGITGDSAIFDDVTLLNPHESYSYFIAKFDANGDVSWAKSIQERSISNGFGFNYNQFDIDKEGNAYIGGQAKDSLYFEDKFDYENIGDADVFVSKYTSDGALDWVKFMESTDGWISAIAALNPDHICVSGNFSKYLTFNDNELLSENQNGFLAVIGADQNKPIITTCASNKNIDLNTSDELLVPDLTTEVVASDNFSIVSNLIITQNPEAGSLLASSNGQPHNVIISVQDEDGNVETCTVILTGEKTNGINNLDDENLVSIYPIPSSDQININFLFPENKEYYTIEVFDLYGRKVFSKNTNTNVVITKSDVKHPGVYFVKVNTKKPITAKIIFN